MPEIFNRNSPTLLILALLALGMLAGCSDIQTLGATAAEQRRVMNDMQARATMAAVCDISLGAYLRELNDIERQLAGVACGDADAMRQAMVPARLVAPGP